MRRVFPGGWYCDYRGEHWAVLIKHSHIETSRGRVHLPLAQNLLYLRIHPNGIRFAGVGNQDDRCWEWNGELWLDRGIAFGPRAISYSDDGTLHIIRRDPAAPTMQDVHRRIWDFTELGGLTIGGGGNGIYGEDPCIALFPGSRHLVDEGQCRFINASEDSRIRLAYVREDLNAAVLDDYSRAELAALPLALDIPTPEKPKPVPPPAPKPEPTPMPVAPNVLHVVRAVLTDPAFFHVNPAVDVERGQITDEVVRRLGGRPWGRKDRDDNSATHNNSDDALCYLLSDGRFEIYDILAGNPSGSPRESFAAFGYAGTFANGENGYFRDVPNVGSTPPKPGTPAPVASPGAAIDAELASLRRGIADLRALVAELSARPSGGGEFTGGQFALKSHNGQYVCAEGGGGGDVNANRPSAGPWETFTLERV